VNTDAMAGLSILAGCAFLSLLGCAGIGLVIWSLLNRRRPSATSPEEPPSPAPPPKPALAMPARCPGCGHPLTPASPGCPRCRPASIRSAAVGPLEELAGAERVLKRLYQNQAIDLTVYESMWQALAAERARLAAPVAPELQGMPGQPAQAPAVAPAQPPTGAAAVVRPAPTPAAPAAGLAPVKRLAGPPPTVGPSAEPAARPAAEPEVPLPPAPGPVPPPREPAVPPRLSLLSAFMEERHIRWGELIGGLLIVGSTIALVISLWSTIQRFPLLQMGLFVGFGLLLFGVGLYTGHRWRLQTTSRALLIIATLLIPLNFLGLAALGTGPGQPSTVLLAVLAVLAVSAFAPLLYLAGRFMTPSWPLLFWPGVLAVSAWQLALPFLAGPSGELGVAGLLGLGLPPVALYALTGLILCRRADRPEAAGPALAQALFIPFGTATFALFFPLGLLVYRTGAVEWALRNLAPLLPVLGWPAVWLGLALWRSLDPVERPVLRTVCFGLALAGGGLALAGLPTAWPGPAGFTAVAGLAGLLFGLAGVRFALPGLHGPAIGCLSAGVLAGGLAAIGRVQWLYETGPALAAALVSASGGRLLTPLALLLVLLGEIWASRRRAEARIYASGGAIVALAGLILLCAHGLGRSGDPEWLRWWLPLDAILAGYGAIRLRRASLAWAGVTILLGASIQWLVCYHPPLQPWPVALLAQASFCLVLAAVCRRQGLEPLQVFERPGQVMAIASSIAGAAALLFAVWTSPPEAMAWRLVWLSLLWLGLGWLGGRPGWGNAGQVALQAGLAFAVAHYLQGRDWYRAEKVPFFHPWSLQVQGVAATLLGLAWTLLRTGWRRFGTPGRQQAPLGRALLGSRLPFDQWVWPSAAIALAAMVSVGILPEIIRECTPADAVNTAGPKFVLARGGLAWVWWAALLAAALASLTECFRRWKVLGLLALSAVLGLLVAGTQAAAGSVATSWRGWLALSFGLAALPLWSGLRSWLAGRTGWPGAAETFNRLGDWPRGFLLALAAPPLLGLTGLPLVVALAGKIPAGPMPGTLWHTWGIVLNQVAPLGVVSLGLLVWAGGRRAAPLAALAGGALHFTVWIAYAWHRLTGAPPLAFTDTVTFCQWNAVTAAVFIAGWLAFGKLRPVSPETVSPGWVLPVLWGWLGLAWAFNLLVLLPALGGVFFQPGRTSALLGTAGQPLGWLAVGLAGAAGAGLWYLARRRTPLVLAALPLLAGIVLAGCAVNRWDEGSWRTFHLLAAGFTLSAWILWLLGRIRACRERFGGDRAVADSLAWTLAAAGLSASFALRAIGQDPARPWWSFGVLLTLAILFHLAGQGRRQPGYLFLGGVLAQAAVTVWWATRYWTHPTDLIGLLYWNALAAAVQVLGWLAWRRWLERGAPPHFEAGFLRTWSWTALALELVVLGITLVRLMADPARLDAGMPKVGGPLGWAALLLAGMAWLGVRLALHRPLRWGMLWLLAVLPVSLAAFSAYRWGDAGWLGFHLLNLGWLLAGAVSLAAGWRLDQAGPLWPARLNWPDRTSRILPVASRWTVISVIATCALCTCGIGRDPGWPGWESAILALAGILIGAMGLWSAGEWHRYVATGLVMTALFLWRTQSPGWIGRPADWTDLWHLEILVLSISGLFWLAVELSRSRPLQSAGENRPESPAGQPPSPAAEPLVGGPVRQIAPTGFKKGPFHEFALMGALCTLAWFLTYKFWSDHRLQMMDASEPLGWLAWAITLTLGIAFLWVPGDRQAGSVIYFLGLLGLGRLVDGQNLTPRWQVWTGHRLAAAWVMLTGWGWPRLSRLEEWLRRRFKEFPRMPLAARSGAVMPVFGILCGFVVIAAFWVVFTFPEPGSRLATAAALLAAGAGQACLARERGTRDSALAALVLGLLAVLACGWAFQQPGLAAEADTLAQAPGWPLLPATFRHRALVLLAVLAAITFPYGFGLVKLARTERSWVAAARRLMGPLAILGLASLALVLGSELLDQYTLGRVQLGPMAVALVAVSLGLLVVLALLFAVVPGRDPFRLDERGRRVYVWTGEVLLVLLLAHLRLTMPWLFSGFFEQVWPLVVIVLAFAGVSLGELFERQGRGVLAAPLRQTGALLPLLPMLGFWVLPSRVHYTLVMVLAGIVYGTVSLVRRSFLFGLISAVAANLGLWYYLYHTESLAFHRHPQLWLIPLAAAVLVAAAVHRRQLSPARLSLVRYACMVTIYASSTADIFIQGVQSIWLPLALVGLSVCGALLGILLRLRSFLILGTAFLGIALLAMIWHAHEHLGWTWIWWVAGIAAGALILAVFGLFERKRDQLARSLDRLKEWDS